MNGIVAGETGPGAIDPIPPTLFDSNTHSSSAGGGGAKCFQDHADKKNSKLCIQTTTTAKKADNGGDEEEVCSALLNGEECKACFITSDHNCYDSDNGLFSNGFRVDCSNIRGDSASNLTACGAKFRQDNKVKTNLSSTLPTSPSMTVNMAEINSRNNNDGSLFGVLPLVFLGFVAIFVKGIRDKRILAMRRRRTGSATISPDDDDEESMEMVPMTNRSNELPAAVAKEEIQDGHFTFEHFDPAESDIIGASLIAYTLNNDWEKVKKNLERIRSVGKSSDEEVAYYIKTIIAENVAKTWPENSEDDTVFSPLLDDWKRAEPQNADCRIIRAEAYISWAWHARSAALAAHVSQKQFGLFITRLRLAALELGEARRLRPEDPLNYSIGITLMMGLGNSQWDDDNVLSVEDCLTSLQGVAANAPKFYHAHMAALQHYSAKWHGSHEQMFLYARSVTSDLPAGHPLWVLIPMAHFERQLHESSGNRRNRYWKNPEVIHEIENAHRNAFPGQAATSIQAQKPFEKQNEWVCRNYFAYALCMCNLQESARRQLRLIGRRPIKGDPWGSLNQYRRFLLALGFELECCPSSSSHDIV